MASKPNPLEFGLPEGWLPPDNTKLALNSEAIRKLPEIDRVLLYNQQVVFQQNLQILEHLHDLRNGLRNTHTLTAGAEDTQDVGALESTNVLRSDTRAVNEELKELRTTSEEAASRTDNWQEEDADHQGTRSDTPEVEDTPDCMKAVSRLGPRMRFSTRNPSEPLSSEAVPISGPTAALPRPAPAFNFGTDPNLQMPNPFEGLQLGHLGGAFSSPARFGESFSTKVNKCLHIPFRALWSKRNGTSEATSARGLENPFTRHASALTKIPGSGSESKSPHPKRQKSETSDRFHQHAENSRRIAAEHLVDGNSKKVLDRTSSIAVASSDEPFNELLLAREHIDNPFASLAAKHRPLQSEAMEETNKPAGSPTKRPVASFGAPKVSISPFKRATFSSGTSQPRPMRELKSQENKDNPFARAVSRDTSQFQSMKESKLWENKKSSNLHRTQSSERGVRRRLADMPSLRRHKRDAVASGEALRLGGPTDTPQAARGACLTARPTTTANIPSFGQNALPIPDNYKSIAERSVSRAPFGDSSSLAANNQPIFSRSASIGALAPSNHMDRFQTAFGHSTLDGNPVEASLTPLQRSHPLSSIRHTANIPTPSSALPQKRKHSIVYSNDDDSDEELFYLDHVDISRYIPSPTHKEYYLPMAARDPPFPLRLLKDRAGVMRIRIALRNDSIALLVNNIVSVSSSGGDMALKMVFKTSTDSENLYITYLVAPRSIADTRALREKLQSLMPAGVISTRALKREMANIIGPQTSKQSTTEKQLKKEQRAISEAIGRVKDE